MRILFLHSSDSSVRYYRSTVPARALASLGHQITIYNQSYYKQAKVEDPKKPTIEFLIDHAAQDYDLVMTDRTVSYDELGTLAGLRHHASNGRLVVDFDDDFLDVPRWNQAFKRYQVGQAFRECSKQHLRLAEMASVSTQTLVDKFKEHTHAISLCPNFIDPADWVGYPVDPDRALDEPLRIFYGGAAGHFGDLDAVRPSLEAFLREPPVPIRFVSIGAAPFWLHELEREFPGRLVNIPWADFEKPQGPLYPRVVAFGKFDLAIAPLASHPFNEAKSDIKWLEATMQGMPLVASKVGPYNDIPDGCVIRAEDDQWGEALTAVAQDQGLRQATTARAHEAVFDTRTVDYAAEPWHLMVEEAVAQPRILSLEATALPGESPPEAHAAQGSVPPKEAAPSEAGP